MQEVHMKLLTIKHSAKSIMSGLLSANDKMSQKSKRKQKWGKDDFFPHCPLKEYKHSHSTVIPLQKILSIQKCKSENSATSTESAF
jgi:hypothetical protein